MFDGSALDFTENVRITKKVVEFASPLGIGVEGEIGKIGGTEDDITVDEEEAQYTSVDEAVAFAEQTNIDYIAVSVGTATGYTSVRQTSILEKDWQRSQQPSTCLSYCTEVRAFLMNKYSGPSLWVFQRLTSILNCADPLH